MFTKPWERERIQGFLLSTLQSTQGPTILYVSLAVSYGDGLDIGEILNESIVCPPPAMSTWKVRESQGSSWRREGEPLRDERRNMDRGRKVCRA